MENFVFCAVQLGLFAVYSYKIFQDILVQFGSLLLFLLIPTFMQER